MPFPDDMYGPRPGSARRRLEEHLVRRGVMQSVLSDLISNYRVQLLRDIVNVVEMALEDEHVEPGVARRVLDKIIYGGSPHEAEAKMRQDERDFQVETAMFRQMMDNPSGGVPERTIGPASKAVRE